MFETGGNNSTDFANIDINKEWQNSKVNNSFSVIRYMQERSNSNPLQEEYYKTFPIHEYSISLIEKLRDFTKKYYNRNFEYFDNVLTNKQFVTGDYFIETEKYDFNTESDTEPEDEDGKPTKQPYRITGDAYIGKDCSVYDDRKPYLITFITIGRGLNFDNEGEHWFRSKIQWYNHNGILETYSDDYN